jgi:hypothetical protein
MPDLDELLAAEAERYDIRPYPLGEIRARHRRRLQARAAAALTAAAVTGVAAVFLPGLSGERERVVADGRPAQTPDGQEQPPAGQPELGRIPTPPEVLRTLPRGPGRGAPPPPPDGTVDVLARYSDGGVNVGTYGWISGSVFCMTRFVDKPSYGQASQEPAACGPLAQDLDRLGFSRSLGLRPGGQLKQVIWGFAPTGTAQVRLSAPGQKPLVVPAFQPGSAWPDGLHFIGTWPAKTAVMITALAQDGRELGRLAG